MNNKTDKITIDEINSNKINRVNSMNDINNSKGINYTGDSYVKSRVVKVIINGEKSENGIIPRNAGNLEIQVLIY